MNTPIITERTQTPTAIITGGGGEIGLAIAQTLLEQRWAVVLAGRTLETLKSSAEKLAAYSANILCVTADVSAPQQAEKLINRTVAWRGRIDALVNNAGYATMVPLAQTTNEQWQQTLHINLSGAFYTLRAAWPVFERQFSAAQANTVKDAKSPRGGVVVNISSEASRDPFPGLGAYGVAKAGLNLLTRVVAREGASIGLRALAIAPAAVETPMFRSLPVATNVPASAILAPESVARAVKAAIDGDIWCASGETIFIHANI